jgi:hypothetical protein
MRACTGIKKRYIYRASQEECARLREGVPYVKEYRYNPKHLCPKLNGYGDNCQRKVWSTGGSIHCTCQLTVLSMSVLEWGVIYREFSYVVGLYQNLQSAMLVTAGHSCVMYSAWNPKDNYDMSASVFVVQFNGFVTHKLV